jgi:hypothetical protein
LRRGRGWSGGSPSLGLAGPTDPSGGGGKPTREGGRVGHLAKWHDPLARWDAHPNRLDIRSLRRFRGATLPLCHFANSPR